MTIPKFVVTTVFVFAGVNLISAQAPSGSTIDWMHSANSAASLARQLDLPMLVYVTSDNCGYCQKLKRDVWSDPDVIAIVNNGFVPLELHSQRNAKLVAALQIRAFPTTLIILPDGRPLHRIKGYKPPNEFETVLRDSLRDRVGPQYVASDQEQPPRRIRWQQSVKEVGGLAQQSKLPILVYVASDNCVDCRNMEREVWGNAEIVSMVEADFIPLELKAERDARLVESLQVQNFPTTVLLSWDARQVASKAGYLSPNQLAAMLRGGQRKLLASQRVRQTQ